MHPASQRDILRALAADVAELAQQPIQQERIALWTALNDLKPQRPTVWITGIPWDEIENDLEELGIRCEQPALQAIERAFRRTLFTARHLRTDEVVQPHWWVPMAIEGTGGNVQITERTLPQGSSYSQSHHYEQVIRDVDDLDLIAMPQVRHNVEETARRVAQAESLFGDILPIKARGCAQHFNNNWDLLVRWTGVTEALIDLYERPEFMHALLRRMTDMMLSRMTQLEQQGLLARSNEMSRIGSGAAGHTAELPQPDADETRLRLIDQWGGATCQIFAEISPSMYEEFALNYELETLSRCGLNYYGCCESVHNKMELLALVPRLRKVSISPWCDVARAAERAAHRYVFSHKPNPAILAADRFDDESAAQDLRDRLERSEGMPCEFVMKDISTVRRDPARVIEWCRIAHQVATEHTG